VTIRSILELIALADTNLPDNTTQLISAADVRDLIKDFLETMSPAYGGIRLASQALTLSATTPVSIAPFATDVIATLNYYTNNLVNGTVTRLGATLGGTLDFIIASGSVSGGNNNNVTVELFKNGVATGYRASVTCSGAGDRVGFNIAALEAIDAANSVYDIRAMAPAGSYTFTDVLLLVQAQPRRSFV
jgi:hypothetical protein